MALAYTVNWIEQGRNPVEIGDSGSYDTIGVEYRYVVSGRRYYRQSRTRRGTVNWTSTRTMCDITYRAVTISQNGVTSQITAAQAEAIQADAYTSTACQSCSTAREDGPNFSVTRVERAATPLVATGSSSTTWGEWSAWAPTLPS